MKFAKAFVATVISYEDNRRQIGSFIVRKDKGFVVVRTIIKEDDEDVTEYYKRVVRECFYTLEEQDRDVKQIIINDNKIIFDIEKAHYALQDAAIDLYDFTDGEGIKVFWDDLSQHFIVENSKGFPTMYKFLDTCEFRAVGGIDTFQTFHSMLLNGHYREEAQKMLQYPF